MDLVINATILNQPRLTGLGIYTVNVLQHLFDPALDSDEFDRIKLIGSRARLEELFEKSLKDDRVRVAHCPTVNPLWRLIELNRLVARRRDKQDLVFYSPTHHGVTLRGVPQVITIHDLFARLFPANYRSQYLYFRYYLPRILARTSTVVTVSENTASDLAKFYRAVPDIVPIHEATRSDLSSIEPIKIPRLADQRFYLFIGPSYEYKNCVRLIDAFCEYRRSGEGWLVFSGGRQEYLQTLSEHIERSCPHLRDSIIFLGYVEPGELVWLYQHAICLMMVTLYEGFGLPALEAMQFDCPVVAANVGALPEVSGEAAYFVDPRNVSAIAGAMDRLGRDQALGSRLVAAGRTNLKRFSWEKTAREVFQVIRECC